MHVQTLPRYILLKNVWEHELGRVSAVEGCKVPCLWRGHKPFCATYSHVTLALTPMVCTKPSTGQRSTEHSCLNTHKKEHHPEGTGDMRRWSERLAEVTCGWRCAPGRRGSMPTGYVPEGLQLSMSGQGPLRDCGCGPLTSTSPTPEHQQPWGTVSDPRWGRDTETQRGAEGSQQESSQSSRKEPWGERQRSCSACHPTEGAGHGLSIMCSKNQGSWDGAGRGVLLKLKVGKGEDLRGLTDRFLSPSSQIHD